MGTLGVVILFLGIALLDIRNVWKNKDKKEKILYIFILSFAFVLTELHVLGFKLIGLNHIVDGFMKQ
jgi:hypothetical protein